MAHIGIALYICDVDAVLFHALPPSFPTTSERLCWFAGGGRELRTGPQYFHDAATRLDAPHIVLQLTLSGCGFHQRPGHPRTLLPTGTAFLDRIPGPYCYGWHAGRYELLFLSLRGPAVTEWLRQVHDRYGPVLDFGDDASVLDAAAALLQQARASLLRDRYLVSARIYGLMMQVLSSLAHARRTASDLARRAIHVIDARAQDPRFNIAALARQLDCSREHLAREFRRAVAASPLAYLTRQRIRLAASDLRGSTDKLDVVARRSGFTSASYLCRRFRAHVGVTPEQFRRQPWLTIP